MGDFRLLIGGGLEAGARSTDVIDPATEEAVASCPRASEEQLDRAVAAAREAFPDWSRRPIAERRAVLERVAAVVSEHAAELGRLLTREQGKPLRDAIGEAHGLAAFTRHFAAEELPVEVLDDGEKRRVEVHHRPLGVVAAIVPWNFPLVLLGFKLGPALIAGNTLVVKPAPTTPLSTLRVGELLRDVVPPGVVNVLADDGDLGPRISAHPDIQKVSFTGSTETGSKVMAGAAGSLKRLTLELGGNDAGLVLGDVDPKQVAPKILESAFRNCGQVCIALKRVYAHEDVYDELCEELAAGAKALRQGAGLDEDTQIGPLQNRRQFEKVKAMLEEARKRGKVIAGGSVSDGPGYFIEPTVVRDIDETARVVGEEQFGPLLPVLRFADAEEALERINRCDQGLGGSVWSRDEAKALELASRLEAGTVWINQHAALDPGIPFGGAKQSGMGVELGRRGLEEFTQLQVVNLAR